MAKHVLWNAYTLVNAVDLSDHNEVIEFTVELGDQPAAGMGEIQDYSMPGTQVVGDITGTYFQDYASSKVYQTLMPLWVNRTTFNLVMKADAGAVAATNPQWTVPVFLKRQPVLAGTRGQRHMIPVVFKPAGLLVTATS